jgi:iduronate 2-sulfatase
VVSAGANPGQSAAHIAVEMWGFGPVFDPVIWAPLLVKRLVLLLLILTVPALGHLRAAARPNVLFIAVDDLKPAIGCYGDPAAKTPNIDRLAARGTIFERAYCMQAVCAPSRNSMLTGLRSETLRIYDLGTNFRRRAPDVMTLPQWFKEQGYISHGLGKIFHVGHGNHEDAASWSVPHFQAKTVSYALPENKTQLSREQALFENKLAAAAKAPKGVAYESTDAPDETYADGVIAREAITRLRHFKESGEEFFLAVGFLKPHLPFCAPKKYWDLHSRENLPMPERDTPPEGAPTFAPTGWSELRNYAGMPEKGPLSADQGRTLIHGYYAATSYMDAQLGKVLDELDALGLAESTIVVLWGDHGWHLGDHGMWCKHSTYEQATRAPLIIAAPGRKTEKRSAALVEFIDVYSTVCDLARVAAPPHLEGRSLVSLMEKPNAPGRSAAFQVFPRGNRETGKLLGHAVRSDRWRYVEWRKEDGAVAARELYDMEGDRGETVNLAEKSEHQAVVTDHARLLQERLAIPPPAGLNLLDPKASAGERASTSAAPARKVNRVELFNKRDKDHDGKLTLAEFLTGQPDPEDAPKRFPKFDADKDGALSREEFVGSGKAEKQ